MWREKEFWLLVLLVVGTYFTRIDQPTLRGEETRWAGCAREILASGDWIVPRQQGQVHADRPPLVNWAIAVAMMAFGDSSVIAVRLPSLLATLLTTIVIYGYARTFLSGAASLAAAGAYATMGQVLQLARLAESEAVLTLWVSASLLVWHWGYSQGWSKTFTWCSGYLLAALAALAKGPQGPVYFVGAIGIYLLVVRRDWRYAVSPAHAVGVLLFVAVIGAWQIPFYLATDWQAVRSIWGHQASARFDYSDPWPVLKHLAIYPWEVLGSMLPWSLLLLAFLHRGFRDRIGTARPQVVFLLTCIFVTFPSVWLATTARSRYFMPLYPCFALLIGLVIERCWQAETRGFWQGYWKRFAWGTAAAMSLAAVGILVVSLSGHFSGLPVAEPAAIAIAFAIAALLLAAIVAGSQNGQNASAFPARRAACVAAVLASIGLVYTGAMLNTIGRTSENVAASVQQLRAKLPVDAELVSFGRTHHRFAFHYGRAIPVVAWPQANAPAAAPDWFCFAQSGPDGPQLPFAWEPVAEISCERRKMAEPWDKVVVGRRLNAHQASAAAPPLR